MLTTGISDDLAWDILMTTFVCSECCPQPFNDLHVINA